MATLQVVPGGTPLNGLAVQPVQPGAVGRLLAMVDENGTATLVETNDPLHVPHANEPEAFHGLIDHLGEVASYVATVGDKKRWDGGGGDTMWQAEYECLLELSAAAFVKHVSFLRERGF